MGHGWEANAEGFREGRIALPEVTLFDTSRQRVHRAGEVTLPGEVPEDARLSQRQRTRLDRASSLLIHAGLEAWRQSGWDAEEIETPVPLCLGTSAGAMGLGEAYYRQTTTTPNDLHAQPSRVALYQTHRQARHLLDAFGVAGPVTIIANACSSGANAIGHAFRLVKTGQYSRALCGGYDALCELVFAGFDSLQALSTTTPRPFDANRDGLALGEGAALLTVETLESAQRRGAPILAEIVGYGAATDVHHLTQPHPEGVAALRTMRAACREAGLSPADIGYINSHGTGTPLNDVAEGKAIQEWAGDGVSGVSVSSTKSGIGHLLGGAGAVEAVISLMALRGNWLPPTTTVETPDEFCTFDLVTRPRDKNLTAVLTNSFGFGGANATVIFKKAA